MKLANQSSTQFKSYQIGIKVSRPITRFFPGSSGERCGVWAGGAAQRTSYDSLPATTLSLCHCKRTSTITVPAHEPQMRPLSSNRPARSVLNGLDQVGCLDIVAAGQVSPEQVVASFI